MLNRRLIRIKVFQTIFGHFKDQTTTADQLYAKAEKSILGAENTFLAVLSFLPALQQFIQLEHNPEDNKFRATEEDISTYQLITDNPFTDAVEANLRVSQYINKPTISWSQEKDMLFLIYKEIRKLDRFNQLKSIEDTKERSLALASLIYKYLIMESVDFEHFMEEHVIVWYDEKIPTLKNLERVFTSFEKQGEVIIPPLSRDLDEDLEFAEILIKEYVAHSDELEHTLSQYTPGWDSDRIMKIDFVLMCMALCEFKYLSFVPVKVSINEYIEIAKMYSTPKSSKFLNGTLDKILKDWQTAGNIQKSGRGLIG